MWSLSICVCVLGELACGESCTFGVPARRAGAPWVSGHVCARSYAYSARLRVCVFVCVWCARVCMAGAPASQCADDDITARTDPSVCVCYTCVPRCFSVAEVSTSGN